MGQGKNRTPIANAFRGWINSTIYITDLLADEIRWEIVGNSAAFKHCETKQQFVDEVLHPFGARFRVPFRPTIIRSIYEDGAIVVVPGCS